MRLHRLTAPVLAALVLAGCGAEETDERSRGKNLLLITVDTLRPDRLGHAGHERETSPAVDRLAAGGVRFSNAYSQSGWTLPSIASILTGRHPTEHGATQFDASLFPGQETLATVLNEAGYDNHAFVSHVMLRPGHGLAAGFDSYDDSVLYVGDPEKVTTARELTTRAITKLPALKEPFFLWLHYFDPHFDYMAHEEWSDWGSELVDLYDGEIALTDREIGRLLDELERRGLFEDTLTVFTADHGEAFGEQGTWRHASLREEVLRIPLVLHGIGLEPRVEPMPVQQVDLVPTILAALDLEAPAGLRGRDILKSTDPLRPIFSERRRPEPFVQRSVLRGADKLVQVDVLPGVDRGSQEYEETVIFTGLQPGIFLFDLANDPLESNNLYSPDDAKAQELLALLDGAFDGAPAPAAAGEGVQIDDETREKLRALGYLD